MRIGWPDFAKLLGAYRSKDPAYRDFVLSRFEHNVYGEFWDEILSDGLFDWEHRYAYTEAHLTRILEDIGFAGVAAHAVGESPAGISLDTRDDPATTFLEATKSA
jgi:hypothetical protein